MAKVTPHQMAFADALRLFAIIKTNAHDFCGESGVYHEVIGGDTRPQKSALCPGFRRITVFQQPTNHNSK